MKRAKDSAAMLRDLLAVACLDDLGVSQLLELEPGRLAELAARAMIPPAAVPGVLLALRDLLLTARRDALKAARAN